MIAILTITHVLICILLVLVVLMQSGKGSDIGSLFGGGASQTLFGATGGKNILTRITTILAVAFMLNAFLLALLPSYIGSGGGQSSLIKKMAKEAEKAAEMDKMNPIGTTISTNMPVSGTVVSGKPSTTQPAASTNKSR